MTLRAKWILQWSNKIDLIALMSDSWDFDSNKGSADEVQQTVGKLTCRLLS